MRYQYLYDKQFLQDLDYLRVKEIFTKIIILDLQENNIREIEGKISQGGILNIDGSSSLRRTVDLTFIPDDSEQDLTNINNLISINKKIKIEVGYSNTLNDAYPQYKNYPIIWFPLGVFVITEASFSESLSGPSISISGQDKMCLLNGTCGGVIPAAATLYDMTIGVDTNGEDITEATLIYDIIRGIVQSGGELSHKIIINDIPLTTKDIVRRSLSSDVPIYRKAVTFPNGTFSHYQFSSTSSAGATLIQPGDIMGYREVRFVYPEGLKEDLNVEAGQTVCDILDKIKETLGNYEYYYDVEGNFIFQEIKNYLNTPYSQIDITNLQNGDYALQGRKDEKNVYDFKSNELVISFNNNPNYSNVYNDFIIWGEDLDTSLPLRYHLVIDKKPVITDDDDWRNLLYLDGQEAEADGFKPNYYYAELKNEWPKVYDTINKVWYDEYLNDPTKFQYYLDFLDTEGPLEAFNVSNIGRRTKVINNSKINCIFPPRVPSIYLYAADESPNINNIEEEAYGIFNSDIASELSYGAAYTDAFSFMRELLHQHALYNDTISMQTIPIFYLEPNTRIQVYNESTNSFGEYVISSLSVPISINETMSINANRALERV